MKIFKKNNWSKWEHVIFIEDFGTGIPTFELLKRINLDTGLTEYKKVKVSSSVHNLSLKLTEQFKKQKNEN
jgi:hypothetical protein